MIVLQIRYLWCCRQDILKKGLLFVLQFGELCHKTFVASGQQGVLRPCFGVAICQGRVLGYHNGNLFLRVCVVLDI